MRRDRINEFVFLGDRREQVSNMAMLMLLRRMRREDLTVHGFRATFKTWATEQTKHPREAIEAALAPVGDKLEEAYQRGDLFEKRRRLMDDWARFAMKRPASKSASNVTRLAG